MPLFPSYFQLVTGIRRLSEQRIKRILEVPPSVSAVGDDK